MKLFFSKTYNGFFTSDMGDRIPNDVVEITASQHRELLDGTANGKIITADESGNPILIDPALDIIDLKATALSNAYIYFAKKLQVLTGNAQQAEKDTWSLKLTIATNILAKTELSITEQAFVTGSGLSNDTDITAWANSVIENSIKYSTYVGIINQLQSSTKTSIKSAETVAQLNQVIDNYKTTTEQTLSEII